MAATTTTPAPEGTGSLHAGDPGLEAWQNLLRGHAQLLGVLDAELQDAHRISLGDYDVMVHLASAPEGMRMCELAEAVVLSASGISRRVERLERSGFVERRRSSSDARSVEARITPEGLRLFRRARKTHLAGVKSHFVDNFAPNEIESLRDLLALLPTDSVDACPSEA